MNGENKFFQQNFWQHLLPVGFCQNFLILGQSMSLLLCAYELLNPLMSLMMEGTLHFNDGRGCIHLRLRDTQNLEWLNTK